MKQDKKLDDRILMKEWGKDHWCLFGYIITRHLDYKGILDRNHLHESSIQHPIRLKDYFQDNTKCRYNYGDKDILLDFVHEGLIKLTNSFPTEITEKGYKIVIELIKQKRKGKFYSEFKYGEM